MNRNPLLSILLWAVIVGAVAWIVITLATATFAGAETWPDHSQTCQDNRGGCVSTGTTVPTPGDRLASTGVGFPLAPVAYAGAAAFTAGLATVCGRMIVAEHRRGEG